MLHADKPAIARRTASLERKGYLRREPNPEDGRSQLLYAAEAADGLRNSKAHIEEVFYTWLLEDLDREEAEQFCATLDKLYQKSKAQRKADFRDVAARLEQGAGLLSGRVEGAADRHRYGPCLQCRPFGETLV